MAVAYRSHALGILPSGGGDTGGADTVITYPAGVAAGDLLVIHLCIAHGGSYVTPAGWTKLFGPLQTDSSSAYGNWMYVLYKIAGGSEPSTVSIPSGGNGTGVMIAYTGADATTPINASASSAAFGGGTSKTAPDVTTTVADTMVLRMFMLAGSAANTVTTPPGGQTERYEHFNDWSNHRLQLSEHLFVGPGATGTSTATFAGSITNGASATVAIAPAAGGGGGAVYVPKIVVVS